MGSDHYVRPRSEDFISRESLRCRDIATDGLSYDFNVANFIEMHLQNNLYRGYFEIEFFNRRGVEEDLAYVTYNPLDLHVDKNLWVRAKQNDPLARYILAHEIGHLYLHDNFDLAFSAGKENQLKYADVIHSAEWQANTFAHHFLVPDHIADKMQTEHDIAAFCAVEQQVAEKRFGDRVMSKKRSIFTGGASCGRCFRYDVFRTEAGARCFFCKSEAPITPNLTYRSDPDLTADTSHQQHISSDYFNAITSAPIYEGEPCTRCANFTLVRDREYFRCSTCKKTERVYRQYSFQI